MKSPSFLPIALITLTCLAWSPADARLFDTVVPKTNPSLESSLSLIGTDAINNELIKMKKLMPSNAEVTQLESMVREVVPIDGGTAYIDESYEKTMTLVNKATNTMLDKLVSDYGKAKNDLWVLEEAIDDSVQNITDTDLLVIFVCAKDWCEKKRTLETAIDKYKQTENLLEKNLAAPLALPHILVKEVAGLGEADCSKAQGTTRDGSCPPQTCALSSRISAKVDFVRADYLRLSWLKYDNNEAKIVAMKDESKVQGGFQDLVASTAINYHSICLSQDKIHDAAVSSFNKNNDVRASMYVSLGTIQCHMNHMKSGKTFDIRSELLKTGETNPSTNANNCMSKLKSDASIKTDIFPDVEGNKKECPLPIVYEGQIKEYGNFGFHKDETYWSPNQPKCEAVGVSGLKGPDMKVSQVANSTFFFIGP